MSEPISLIEYSAFHGRKHMAVSFYKDLEIASLWTQLRTLRTISDYLRAQGSARIRLSPMFKSDQHLDKAIACREELLAVALALLAAQTDE